ncbi:hypothetical protein M427DRAFT_59635 [Gonapodya prolifera JEL478]|uniref:ABM domain-containing protein n=1 Tax=Gonapodya prolifera (strain JEL478) TaxID=1344416 RepID=A0A139A6N1_GONPJ|nr:hypothetical protein M427DRAFT_59635 [Gonapodya prolifera JEL478]|eukprot:KXS12298.1 hypothetical protein M427DRAFT_59635 [Gonapodya prolifera JEL478]
MAPVRVVAHLTANNAEDAEKLLANLQEVIPKVLAEEGCLEYQLTRDLSSPTHFVFIETWESAAHLAAHAAAPHMTESGKQRQGWIKERAVHRLEVLGGK